MAELLQWRRRKSYFRREVDVRMERTCEIHMLAIQYSRFVYPIGVLADSRAAIDCGERD